MMGARITDFLILELEYMDFLLFKGGEAVFEYPDILVHQFWGLGGFLVVAL